MSTQPKTQEYREMIDELVRMCHGGQGQIGPRRVREGVWGKSPTIEKYPEQHKIHLLLERLPAADREVIAGMLEHAVETGVFETLKVLEIHGIKPFEDGYEGSPYNDFIGRLDGWNWPKA